MIHSSAWIIDWGGGGGGGGCGWGGAEGGPWELWEPREPWGLGDPGDLKGTSRGSRGDPREEPGPGIPQDGPQGIAGEPKATSTEESKIFWFVGLWLL